MVDCDSNQTRHNKNITQILHCDSNQELSMIRIMIGRGKI